MLVSATLLPTVAFAQETTASNSKPTSDAAPLAFCSVEPVTFSSQALMPKGHVKVEANRTEIIQDTVALFSGNVDIHEVPKIRAIDIDNKIDFLYAEYLKKRYK